MADLSALWGREMSRHSHLKIVREFPCQGLAN
jgi:hypothetical protein